MKKRFLGIAIFMFIVFMSFINKTDALTCNYGIKSDDGKWKKWISFDVKSFNKINVNTANSPILKEFNYEDDAEDNKNFLYYVFRKEENFAIDDYYKIYLSLYSNESMYKDVKDICVNNKEISNTSECGCPPLVKYYYKSEGGDLNQSHLLIYNDELDFPEMDDHWYLFDSGDDKEGYLFEERYKDKDEKDLIKGDCPTYYYSIKNMEGLLARGGCENNKLFNDAYTHLEEKCENLRAASTYTEDKSNTPKACQKACSNLYDEVEVKMGKICGSNFKGYCGSLGNKIVNRIFGIIRIIRYALPAILIILTIIDYIKALASDDEGEMKKVNKRFAIRLIAIALLFIVPFVLDFILKIFKIPGLSSDNPFCAK